MEEEFIKVVREKVYWKKTDRVLVAVSGGVDSMVLIYLMHSLPADIKPSIAIAHVNHQLRNESDKEEDFLKEWAKNYHIPLFTYTWQKKDHPKSGIEGSAREVRYGFFEKIMEKEGYSVLLTAHHANDQAETVLMKLVRGGTLEQYTGIKTIRFLENGKLIRPLLKFTKEQLYNYAWKKNIPFFEDETNDSLDYSRNRFRNIILPLLKKENKEVEHHLIEFASELTDLLEISKVVLKEKYTNYIVENESSVKVFHEKLMNESPSIQRGVLLELLKRVYSYNAEDTDESFKKSHIPLMIDFMRNAPPNAVFDLPKGWQARKEYEIIRLVKKTEGQARTEEAYHRKIETLNKWIQLTDNQWLGVVDSDYQPSDKDQIIYIEPDSIRFPLTVRHRKKGDRMTVKGMEGTKKVKDIFIDQKIPLPQRDKATIVEDADGKIIWVIGFKESKLSIGPITDRMTYMLVLTNYLKSN